MPRAGELTDTSAGPGTATDAGVPAPILSDPNRGFLRWLLHAVYDLAWFVTLVLGSPWVVWRTVSDRAFRGMVLARLGVALPEPPAPGIRRVLVHGVSVGEIKAAQALVAGLEAEPGVEVVVSTITETGFGIARKLYPGCTVVRFPADLSPVVARFLARIGAVCVVLVELEAWPNFLRGANRAGAPVAVVNGRITDRSFGRYRLFRHLLPQFNRITLFCVQDEAYAERFRALGGDPARMCVTGNLKWDGVATGPREPSPELVRLIGPRSKSGPLAEGEAPAQLVLVAGSTHEPEERLLVEAWRRSAPDARLVLVPRHPERATEIVRQLAAAGTRVQRLSELRAGRLLPDPTLPALVDTIGELEQVYTLADIVFVGGSLIPHGGQNMLEPAAQGRPVVYGPHVANFAQEASLLEAAGASVRVADTHELAAVLARWTSKPTVEAARAARMAMSEAGRRAIEEQRGATLLTLDALRERCLRRP